MATAVTARTGQAGNGGPAAAGPTVLLVEDFDDARSMMRTVLEMEGYRVIEAEDGRQACAHAAANKPDFVLMDLSLPVMDGFAATRCIRHEVGLTRVPVVAVTAHGTPDFRNRALAAGCDEFVTKPIDLKRLKLIMGQLLRRPEDHPRPA